MLTQYIQAAMQKAKYEILSDDDQVLELANQQNTILLTADIEAIANYPLSLLSG
jgi:hypothetical protein